MRGPCNDRYILLRSCYFQGNRVCLGSILYRYGWFNSLQIKRLLFGCSFFLFSCLFGRGPSAYFWLDVALGDVGLVQYLSGRIGGTLESSRSRCVENQILFLTSGDAFSLIISQSPWLQYMGSHVLLFPALRQSLQSYPMRPYGVYPCFLEVGLEVFIVGTVSCVFPGCDTWVGRSRYPWL